MPEPVPPSSSQRRGGPLAAALRGLVLVVLGALVGVVGAFQHQRSAWVGDANLPAGLLGALVALVLAQWVAARAAGRVGAVLLAAGWVLPVMVLASGRAEGDLVVPGDGRGAAFVWGGAVLALAGAAAASVRDLAGPDRAPALQDGRRAADEVRVSTDREVLDAPREAATTPAEAVAAAAVAAADADLREAARREEGGCVVLRLGGSRFAVAMDAVAEVVGVPRLTRVPDAPIWLAGVANWRGRVLPVLDLRPLVGVETTPLASTARMVVLAVAGVEAGVLADAVPGLVNRPDELEPTPATIGPAAASIIEGLLEDDGPVAVVDATAVLALRGRLPGARR